MRRVDKKNLKATTLATIGLLVASFQFQPANAHQFSVGVWGPGGDVNISSGVFGTQIGVSIPGASIRYDDYDDNHYYRYHGNRYHENTQVIIAPQPVYIERQVPPDGYYETGRACHANIVCVNGACYRCN
jgi:hypothetical protein